MPLWPIQLAGMGVVVRLLVQFRPLLEILRHAEIQRVEPGLSGLERFKDFRRAEPTTAARWGATSKRSFARGSDWAIGLDRSTSQATAPAANDLPRKPAGSTVDVVAGLGLNRD